MAGRNRTLSDNSSDDDDLDDLNSADEQVHELSHTSDEDEPPSFKPTSFYSNQSSQSDDNEDDTDQEPPSKKSREDESAAMRMSKAYNIMKSMGLKEGEGLGKAGQGRLEPIAISTQKGRRGLGMKLDDLDNAGQKWDPDLEVIEMNETVKWLINDSDDLNDITRDVLDSWIVVGKVKQEIEDENKFCDPEILEKVLQSKTVFDKLEAYEMRQARTRSNPFETIGHSIFLNRAAVKMANIDSMFNGMFTNPVDENDDLLVRENDLLYFADVCAGPGGFSEYVLWRKKWLAKGFGFTLKECNDFKLDEFKAGSPASFDPYYGVKNDGNVFDPENIISFSNYVLKQTEAGVHFMMADGGFSVDKAYNIQEILSKQLYLCQCIVALSVVREKGHFVCKLFDLFTPFSVGLVYLMYKCFQQITIIKPNTSRPANSERYIVCKWKKPNTDTIYRHLFDINREMYLNNKNSSVDTLELVPYDVMRNDSRFFDYIYDSNNRIGQNQIVGLIKIAAFCKDNTLMEKRQSEIRSQCLQIWGLPDTMRLNKPMKGNEQLCNDILKDWVSEKEFFNVEEAILKDKSKLPHYFLDVEDWSFAAIDIVENCDKTVRSLFMTTFIDTRVAMYSSESGGSWIECQTHIELPPETLVYGEIVRELKGEHRSQISVYAFHIIDGLCLGGIDIRHVPLRKRNEMCQKFAKSLNKPQLNNTISRGIPIRCKPLYKFVELDAFFDRLSYYKLKDGKMRLGYKLRNDLEDDRFFVPRGLLFFKETKEPLQKLWSKTANRSYYFDHLQKKSFFLKDIPDPNTIYASFKTSFCCRRLWRWEMETQVSETHVNTDTDYELLYRTDLNKFIAEKRLP